MVFFNDSVPDASERAVCMAIDMRGDGAATGGAAAAGARDRGRDRAGLCDLGADGFAERVDYTAISTVCNLAARLCAEAKEGQILISRRVAAAVEDTVRLKESGDLSQES